MAQETDIDSLDYRIGFASGKTLAMQDTKLTDAELAIEAQEHYDRSTISPVLIKATLVYGFVRGYRLYLKGIV